MELVREREIESVRSQLVSASFGSWQIGMILSSMFGGKESKWKSFPEWLDALGLGGPDRHGSKMSVQDVTVESARIRSKFEPIANKILKQRAQGVV